jgi:hypothetical protein
MKTKIVLTMVAIALRVNHMEAQLQYEQTGKDESASIVLLPHSAWEFGLAPGGQNPRIDREPHIPDGLLNLAGEGAFCVSVNISTSASTVDKFNLATPGTFVQLSTGQGQSFAGDFASDGVWYGITYPANSLIRIDTTTGIFAVIGACPPQAGDTWTSLEIDPTTGRAHGTAANASTSNLYTINLATGAPSLVGTIIGAPAIISSAFDSTGQLYGVEQSVDNLVRIDKLTGTATVVGALGFDTRFAQDAAFDHATNTMFLAAYNVTLNRGELRTANLTTGNTTLIAPFPASEEVTNLAIKRGTGPRIFVNTPASGAVWGLGTQQTVSWTSQNVTGNVNIRLSTDGGSSFPIVLSSNTPNDGTEAITAPTNPATACRLRIEWVTTADIFGTNAGNFSILDQVAPTVQHTPAASTPLGQPDTVRATISDNIAVTVATLHYRQGGTAAFTSGAMSLVGAEYQASIPGNMVTSQGVEYYISAQDAAGNTGRSPGSEFHSVPVLIGGEGISRGVPQPGGSAQTAYRLVSIPMDADRKSPRDVLEDDLGVYDNTKWRFFELRADQTYIEYPNTSQMIPGKCFWLIVKDAGKIVDSGPGKTDITSGTFLISLNRGWNFVANPFNFPIPRANLSVNGQPPKLIFYNGQWDSVSATSMNPFEGYIVAAESTTNLAIRPQLLLDGRQEDGPAISSERLWGIRVIAQCQDAKDIDNLAAVFSNSSTEQDGNDEPEPPVIGDYVSVSFPHPEWNNAFKRYSVDARPEPTHGDAWKFEVNTNIHSTVRLDFKGLEGVPQQFEVILVDDLLKTTRNLRTTPSYSYHSINAGPPKEMTLVVGSTAYVRQQIESLGTLPASFELSQNFPNPFNPTTTIRYGLPTQSHVTMKVYNLLGQEVATLVDGLEEKGYKTVEFNAGNLSSGVYFYRIQAEGFNEVRKLTIIK